jgi:AcrR family transcriptional regulator
MFMRGESAVGTTLDRIRSALFALARELRPEQITMQAVAERAGISVRTLFRHVGSREGLLELLQGAPAANSPQPEETRQRLLAAAARTFARQGYAGASLDAVAEAAGLTKGAVYWHFASKMDLFLALLDERLATKVAELPALLEKAAAASDPEQALAGLLLTLLADGPNDPDWPRLCLEFISSGRHPAVGQRLALMDRRSQAHTAALIRQLQQIGRLAADLDAEALAGFWIAMLDGLTLAWLKDPAHFDMVAVARSTARLLWRGMAP